MGVDSSIGRVQKWMYSVIAYNVEKLSSLPQHTYKKTKFIMLYTRKPLTKTLDSCPRGRGSGSRVRQIGNVVLYN